MLTSSLTHTAQEMSLAEDQEAEQIEEETTEERQR